MKFKEFKKNAVKWAKDRGIIPNSSFDAQYIKLVEELGELALGLRKRDEGLIKDSIGDVAVVLVILSGIEDIDEYLRLDFLKITDTMNSFQKLCEGIGKIPLFKNNENKDNLTSLINIVLSFLKKLSEQQGYDFMECCELAWNEIKDRKGYLREDGIFIKEEDING